LHLLATGRRRRINGGHRRTDFGLASLRSAKAADDTIKIGVLHSLSGTMASANHAEGHGPVSDRRAEQEGRCSARSSSCGRRSGIELAAFAEKARELITKDKVAVVFGCWTSVSRNPCCRVQGAELDPVLPVQYEGEESERNVFYTGAAPNQQAIPAVDYLAKEEKVKRWVLAGTDYVYPPHHQRSSKPT